MRAYADTSFIVKLVTQEPSTEAAMGEFRRLGLPRLFYLSVHALEVTNAIRQRAFHLKHSGGLGTASSVDRERDIALDRIERWIHRGSLVEATADMEEALYKARALSEKYTERLGCRGFDLLHVALALDLRCDLFLTSDRIQGALAKSAGFHKTVIAGA